MRFQCCEGYSIMSGQPGCAKVKPLYNILETAINSKATKFARMTKEVGLSRVLSTQGPYTLFAPINSAFRNLSEDVWEAMNRSTDLQTMNQASPSLLLYHMTKERHQFSSLQDNTQLVTLYNRRAIYINKFSKSLVTINCIPLTRPNVEATNGVVHLLEEALQPPPQMTLMDHVFRHHEFSVLATVLVKSKFAMLLRDQGPFTVFAPTNDAFNAMTPEYRDSVMADTDAMIAMLKYHMIEGVWCTAAMTDRRRLRTIEGSALHASCKGGKKRINGAPISRPDIVTTNGIIHIIDEVLMPKKAKTLKELAQHLRLTEMLKLVEMAGLENAFTNPGKITVFAPSDIAFEAIPESTKKDLFSDAVKAQEFVMGHVVPGPHTTSSLMDKQYLSTLRRGRNIYVRIYRKHITAGGALVIREDVEARNGILHVIDKVLAHSNMTIGQYLTSRRVYSTFVSGLKASSGHLMTLLDSSKGPFTVFAVDNKVLHKTQQTFRHLLSNQPALTKMIQGHIVKDYIILRALLPKAFYEYVTIGNQTLLVREDAGSVTVGTGTVIKADIVLKNGIVHRISRLIEVD